VSSVCVCFNVRSKTKEYERKLEEIEAAEDAQPSVTKIGAVQTDAPKVIDATTTATPTTTATTTSNNVSENPSGTSFELHDLSKSVSALDNASLEQEVSHQLHKGKGKRKKKKNVSPSLTLSQ
jgi:hypothetical protein